MSAERERSKMEALTKLDYVVCEDLEDVLVELHDCVFGLESQAVSLLNRSLKKFGYKVVKASSSKR